MFLSYSRRLGFSIAPLLLAACVTVPHEAASLSAELGGRIQEEKAMHQDAVRLLMAEKRAEVDRFLETEWLPDFAQHAFAAPAVQAVWTDAIQTPDPKHRIEVVTRLATSLQRRINARRAEMISPLDAIERDLMASLEDHYSQTLAMNATLTGLLGAAARTSDLQEKVLSGLRARPVLDEGLGKAEEVVRLMTQGADALDKNKDRIQQVLSTLKHSH